MPQLRKVGVKRLLDQILNGNAPVLSKRVLKGEDAKLIMELLGERHRAGAPDRRRGVCGGHRPVLSTNWVGLECADMRED